MLLGAIILFIFDLVGKSNPSIANPTCCFHLTWRNGRTPRKEKKYSQHWINVSTRGEEACVPDGLTLSNPSSSSSACIIPVSCSLDPSLLRILPKFCSFRKTKRLYRGKMDRRRKLSLWRVDGFGD
ncbi:hypothetical protein TNCT_98721 [Trichonephila clavata]|uniref:Secreted protein n=1 Tax=Trichonephila clavata TaxID=2740835 RepID=A0A8X6H9K1_TRICU|nr:hypothetical protein TNCT_98721 [Trichonephila clavata]